MSGQRVAAAAALGLALVSSAGGLDAKVARVGVLSGGFPTNDPCLEALRRGLGELGHVERKTFVLEPRWSTGRTEPHRPHAAELVRMKVDVIAAFTTDAALAAKQATATTPIPIVASPVAYPVEMGLVASVARPGGNLTGSAFLTPELAQKRIEVLKEAVPHASRIAVLRVRGAIGDLLVKDYEAAAPRFKVRLQVIEAGRPEDLSGAFDDALRGGAEAVLLAQGPFFFQQRARIAELALKRRLPILSGESESVEAGTLLFHGSDLRPYCHRVATFVDRILKGARPEDLPMELPARVELKINIKTAKALGLTLPRSLLERADRLVN